MGEHRTNGITCRHISAGDAHIRVWGTLDQLESTFDTRERQPDAYLLYVSLDSEDATRLRVLPWLVYQEPDPRLDHIRIQVTVVGGPFGVLRFSEYIRPGSHSRRAGSVSNPDIIVETPFATAMRRPPGLIDPTGATKIAGRSTGTLLVAASLYRDLYGGTDLPLHSREVEASLLALGHGSPKRRRL